MNIQFDNIEKLNIHSLNSTSNTVSVIKNYQLEDEDNIYNVKNGFEYYVLYAESILGCCKFNEC